MNARDTKPNSSQGREPPNLELGEDVREKVKPQPTPILCKNCGHEIVLSLKGKLFRDWYHCRRYTYPAYAQKGRRDTLTCSHQNCKCEKPEPKR